MMNLKPDELAMLNGEEGELRQEAMKMLVALGEVYHATEMVDISFSFLYVDCLTEGIDRSRLPRIISPDLLEDAVREGRKMKVPAIGGLGAVDVDVWKELQIPEEDYHRYLKEMELERSLGVHPTGTCTPYMVVDMDQNPLGAHLCTVESSAIPYYNSILGARVNRGGLSPFWAAVTGKYPKFGYHLDENRYATVQVNVTVPLKSPTDFGLLGLAVGEFCCNQVPVITGIPSAKTPDLISFCCAASSGGPVALFHIPGITAEFRTVEEALNHKEPQRVMEFGEAEMEAARRRYDREEGTKVDMVLLGCPHYTINQLREVALALEGKKLAPNVKMMVGTAPQIKHLAEPMGYVDAIHNAGGILATSTCALMSSGCPGPVYTFTHPDYSAGTVVTDSLKVATYAKNVIAAKRVFVGDTAQCVQAALSGEWRNK